MSDVVELFRGVRFSAEAAVAVFGMFNSLIEPGQGCSVERYICEEGDDEIISLIDSEGLALYTVGQLRDGTYYAFDQDGHILVESRDLDVLLRALDFRVFGQ